MGIHYVTRLLNLEPWREEAHRQLMQLLVWSGQRSAALAQYETCRRVLANSLGVEPQAETRQLYDRILRGDPILSQPAATIGKTTYFRPKPHNLPAQVTPFIGREAELAEVVDRLHDHDCRLLTLVGPGGVGKTRLFATTAHWTL